MRQLIVVMFLFTCLSGPDAYYITDQHVRLKNLEMFKLYVEAGQILISKPSETDSQQRDGRERYMEDAMESNLVLAAEGGGHEVRKRSPRCLLSCLRQKKLHPAQCHSYCRFNFG